MKTVTRLVLTIVIAFSLTAPTISAQGCGNCDGDPNGMVDIADITCLIGYLYLDYPVYGNIDDIDIDGFEGVTSRDLVYLTDFFGGMTFSPFFCPTSSPPLMPTPDSSFLVEYANTVPSGVSKMRVPIFLTISHRLNIVQLPFRLRLGAVIPRIDSIQFTISWHTIGRVDTADGNFALFVPHVFSSPITVLDIGNPNRLASVYISFPPATTDRTLSLDWTVLSPIQAPTLDSSIVPAVFFTRQDGAGVFAPAKKSFICGDVDGSGGKPDITDLTFLIDHLFINFTPVPNRLASNVDGVGDQPDIADLTVLIDHLFINFTPVGC